LPHASQVVLPLAYKGVDLDKAYVVDLIVEDTVVVELKAVEKLLSVHEAQVLTYLRLSERPAGLLINFNVKLLHEGIRRLLR
jgi:GxxExxY protein